jgi:hypothetical protein
LLEGLLPCANNRAAAAVAFDHPLPIFKCERDL